MNLSSKVEIGDIIKLAGIKFKCLDCDINYFVQAFVLDEDEATFCYDKCCNRADNKNIFFKRIY